MLATLLVLSVFLTAGWAVANAPGRASDEPPGVTTVTVAGEYRGRTASEWAARFRHRTRQLQAARSDARREWHPTVVYALRLASAVFDVPYRELASVSACESGHYPFAVNGRYRGLFQEGPMFESHSLGRAGFSVFDPIVNALVAASTVSQQGWRQWSCRP